MKSLYYLLLLFSMISCTSLYRDSPVNTEPVGEISSVRGYRMNQDGLVLSLHQDSSTRRRRVPSGKSRDSLSIARRRTCRF